MDLLILRHGLAGNRDEWEGPDAERPLTAKGRMRTRDAARGLAALGVCPERILTSPFARAAETARLTASSLDAPVVATADLEPGRLLGAFPILLHGHAAISSLMLVGHEPDLSELVGMLIGHGGPARIELKKGACALLRLSEEAAVEAADGGWPQAKLAWLLTARQLARCAGRRGSRSSHDA